MVSAYSHSTIHLFHKKHSNTAISNLIEIALVGRVPGLIRHIPLQQQKQVG